MPTSRKRAPEAEGAPLSWGAWPSGETPLTIADEKGRWSFIGPFACGPWEAVLLVHWAERREASAVRRVVAMTEVRLPPGMAAPAIAIKPRHRRGPAA